MNKIQITSGGGFFFDSHCISCRDVCVDSSKSDGDKARRKTKRELYTCQAWTSFRLDIDAVMNAMFPTSSPVR